ncbi:MAG: glycosyltransferase family 2 protein [Candidatus Hydrogenedentes bacterium]|nr:glycosyltransferase family 2 protein [Candidatus Hydrogenedentota bacterium]
MKDSPENIPAPITASAAGSTGPQDPVRAPRLTPGRGILFTHNAHGQALDLTDLKKWLRLLADRYKVRKADLRIGSGAPCHVAALLDESGQRGIALSLRIADDLPVADLESDLTSDLLDLVLCPSTIDIRYLEAWAARASNLGLPIRLQLPLPLPSGLDPGALTACLATFNAVTFRFNDPFENYPSSAPRAGLNADLLPLWPVLDALLRQGVPVRLTELPFCCAEPPFWKTIQNAVQSCTDTLAYDPIVYRDAVLRYALKPVMFGKVLDAVLREENSPHSPIDKLLLRYILSGKRTLIGAWLLHKLTRHRRFSQWSQPRPLPEAATTLDAQIALHQDQARKNLGPDCAACRLQSVCDHGADPLRASYPDLARHAVPGDREYDPLFALLQQPPYLDRTDHACLAAAADGPALVQAAKRITVEAQPTREIGADAYSIQDHPTHRMPGALRWYSFTHAELQSTVLADLTPPFTMAIRFGGGIASHIGFSFGRYARILCPMTAAQHQLTLHVNAQGRFVLLRDGEPVHPLEFANAEMTPARLASRCQPRICIRNIDGEIVTQALLLWEEGALPTAPAQTPRHSVIIVSTRYARRLQAVLQCLVHQQGIAKQDLEILVAYVPGLDATDDILDGLALLHPEFRILRVPMPPSRARAKGFMLNEAMNLARGERITLLDSDILLPPRFFAALDAVPNAAFIAPEGRHLLTPRDTAAILLGEIRPWESFDELLNGVGDYRHRESGGIPPGFCQTVSRDVIQQIRYPELDHFEGSDTEFSKQVIRAFGPESRLPGMKLLHLDHGGSQWYGTSKHM